MTELEQARTIFGDKVKHLSDAELQSYLTKIQFIIDSWLDMYEKQVFDGKTIAQLV